MWNYFLFFEFKHFDFNLRRKNCITEGNHSLEARLLKKISVHEFHMFWFYIITLSSHIINGLVTGFARAILRNTGPWSFSTALASLGRMKTSVLYFSVWPSHPVNKPLLMNEHSTILIPHLLGLRSIWH